MGAQTGNGPIHRGSDALAEEGTDVKLLVYNETSRINKIDERTDTTQGKYVEVATTFTYNYMGQDYSETILTRNLHMSSISVTVESELNYNTSLGKTGKTGEWNKIPYGAHAHEDIYVANGNNYKNTTNGSPYLNYLSDKNGNVKIEHDNKVWYDKFLFADKSKYSFTPDANSYK